MKNIIYTLILSTLIIIMGSCSKSSGNKKAENSHSKSDNGTTVTKALFESSKMKLENITEQTFPTTIKVTGMIDAPPQSVEIISSFSGGYIKKSALLIGDKVKKVRFWVSNNNIQFLAIFRKNNDKIWRYYKTRRL